MTVLRIVIGEESPILRLKTKNVPRVTKEIASLVADMRETCIAAKGAGIAAPQINRSERICIAMISKKLIPMINPVISWKGDMQETAEEGCLSLPEVWIHVTRPSDIIVSFLTVAGKKRELKLSGWNARVVQHEVDHLEGILITDHRRIGAM